MSVELQFDNSLGMFKMSEMVEVDEGFDKLFRVMYESELWY